MKLERADLCKPSELRGLLELPLAHFAVQHYTLKHYRATLINIIKLVNKYVFISFHVTNEHAYMSNTGNYQILNNAHSNSSDGG